MLVFHAAWSGDRFGLWAERAWDGEAPVGRAGGAHPFAATADELTAALSAIDPQAVKSGAVDETELLLPCSVKQPVPSPALRRPVRISRPKVRSWRVPMLFVPSATAIDVLADVGGHDEVLFDRDVTYWRSVAEFGADLAARGRVLPQLVREDTGFTARWRPVLTGQDAAVFTELASALPPVCRAVGGENSSSDVLLDAVNALCDATVRARVSESLLPGRQGGRLTSQAQWLKALTGHAPDLRLPEDEALRLSEPLRDWFAAAHADEGDVRVCLRLDDPDEDESVWRLWFSLQSMLDPSLEVPAETVWTTTDIQGLPDRADEALSAGLGRAARIYPELDRSLRTAQPVCLELDTAAAHAFLQEAAPLLQAAGFGVRLPHWVRRAKLGYRLSATSSKSGPGSASPSTMDSMLEFRLELAVGDVTVSAEEIAELAALKVPLVRLRGQWVELDTDRLKQALSNLEKHGRGEVTVGEALSHVTGAAETDLPIVSVQADGRFAELLSGDAAVAATPLATPGDFVGELRDYQARGLTWLESMRQWNLGAILADDMGLGKTAQTLALLIHERRDGTTVPPTLLVCPMSLIANWQHEVTRFAPTLRSYVHHGPQRLRGDDLAAGLAELDLVITTYGTALRDRDELSGFQWERVVCDEAQAIKNHAARQSAAVRSLNARTRLALTGTPVENHLAELWSIMEFCNPGLMGPYATFRRRFQEPIERDGDPAATQALRQATTPFVLRRLKTDKAIISDLPDKIEMNQWCHLTTEQASLYQAITADMLNRIEDSEGIERHGNVLAAMTKLKQVCNHPAQLLQDGSRLDGRSGKLNRLEELCAELIAEGDKALVFTQFAEMGTLLQPHLEAHLDREVLWLHGGLTRKRRAELVERFQTSDEPLVFLLSLKAAGTGLNLTAANHVIHFDRWWNPAVENQATDRAFRIGQSKNVQVRKFICQGTLEERIDRLIESKQALSEQVVGSGESWLGELSTDQLHDIFALSKEATL